MTFLGKLYNAEQQGREVAWQGLSRARCTLEEAQSRLRRKMRIHPRTPRPLVPVSVTVEARESPAEPAGPMVTVNREDLPPEESGTPEKQIA